MGKPDKPKPCPRGVPGWVVTFGDLNSLLLTFFVLLLSFSSMDIAKFKQISGSMEKAFGVQTEVPVYENPVGDNLIAQDFSAKFEEDIIKKLTSAVKKFEKSNNEAGEDNIQVFKDYRGVVLRVNGNYIFDTGSYIIKPTAWPLLDEVYLTFSKTKEVELYIEAHTDSTPINSKEIPTNWELSALRSISIVRYFVEGSNGQGEFLHGVGRGDSIPLFPNNSDLNKMRNRRVEFIFTQNKKNKSKISQ